MAKAKLDENFVAENIKEIIEGLDVSATVEVSKEGDIFFVDITSPDSALLIGKYGANLESLQFVLAVRIKVLTGKEDFEVFVDINDWRKQKEDRLKKMALSVAEQVIVSMKEQPIYNLKSSERRVVHTVLSDHPQVTTVSEGDGPDRHLIVKPRIA